MKEVTPMTFFLFVLSPMNNPKPKLKGISEIAFIIDGYLFDVSFVLYVIYEVLKGQKKMDGSLFEVALGICGAQKWYYVLTTFAHIIFGLSGTLKEMVHRKEVLHRRKIGNWGVDDDDDDDPFCRVQP